MRGLIWAAVLLGGCASEGRGRSGGSGGGASGGGSAGATNLPDCNAVNPPPDGDQDQDGYTPAQGDCNDCNPSINPGAIQIPGDPTDWACNGTPGVLAACPTTGAGGARDATSLAQAMDLCDPRFLVGAMLAGPSDARARKVIASFGVIAPRLGSTMALVSNGIAADKSDPDFDATVEEDPGTDLSGANTFAHPFPTIPPNPMCGQTAPKAEPPTVNDYTELVLKLKAPSNAKSFSFDFEFFSAEYPAYVCTLYNDELLVLQQSPGEFTTATNIAFDMQNNPVTVNNGFFTVCQNDPAQKYTQHCTHPLGEIAGTGFGDPPLGAIDPATGMSLPPVTSIPGGATGWLTTTSPVSPGEEVTLRFVIFDEGDHILDSAAVLDNFRWSAQGVPSPSTGPIQ